MTCSSLGISIFFLSSLHSNYTFILKLCQFYFSVLYDKTNSWQIPRLMSATRKRVAILSPLGMNWLVQRGQILPLTNLLCPEVGSYWTMAVLGAIHQCYLWLWRRNVDQIIPWISNKTNTLKSLQTCISFIKKKSDDIPMCCWLESRHWDSNYCAKVLIGNSLGTRSNGRKGSAGCKIGQRSSFINSEGEPMGVPQLDWPKYRWEAWTLAPLHCMLADLERKHVLEMRSLL